MSASNSSLSTTPAFDEGVSAYQDGLWLNQNPYGPLTFHHDQWERGWIQAQLDDPSNTVVEESTELPLSSFHFLPDPSTSQGQLIVDLNGFSPSAISLLKHLARTLPQMGETDLYHLNNALEEIGYKHKEDAMKNDSIG